MYLVKTPRFIQKAFPAFIWKFSATSKVIYLTFDDGPIPEVTPWVLDTLAVYRAKATFFCVGENVKNYPRIFEQILLEGHSVGNHTYNHVNGWSTPNLPYLQNVEKCAEYVTSELFRPPYGKLKPGQAAQLQDDFNVVMWDVLSGDFDHKVTKQECLKNVVEHAGAGSIVVFHDSIKAWENLEYALPRVLEHYTELGYSFEAIRSEQFQSLLMSESA